MQTPGIDIGPLLVLNSAASQMTTLVGQLNWVAARTWPDLATAVSSLASCNSCPSEQHLQAALCAVRYLRSTASQGTAFHSSASPATSACTHFPPAHDSGACSDVLAPKDLGLTGCCDANWGSQIRDAIADGEKAEMFKYRSVSGYLVMRCGGLTARKAGTQGRTSRSTCEAEMRATDEVVKESLSMRTSERTAVWPRRGGGVPHAAIVAAMGALVAIVEATCPWTVRCDHFLPGGPHDHSSRCCCFLFLRRTSTCSLAIFQQPSPTTSVCCSLLACD